MEFLNKLRGSAEDKVKQKAQDEADKKTAKLSELKDSANSVRKAKTSAEKLVKEIEIVGSLVVEIGAHAQSGEVKALAGVAGRLNASRVVISENLEVLKECFENLKQVGLGHEDAHDEDAEGDTDKAKGQQKKEEPETGLRRIVRVLSDIIGEVTLIADRKIPSIVESSEALAEESEAGGVEAAKEKAKTLGSIGKDCNDIRKRAMNVKKHVQSLKSTSSDGEDGEEEDSEGQGKDIKNKGNGDDKDGRTIKKDPNPSPESADKNSSSSCWSKLSACCCCTRKSATRPK